MFSSSSHPPPKLTILSPTKPTSQFHHNKPTQAHSKRAAPLRAPGRIGGRGAFFSPQPYTAQSLDPPDGHE